MKDLIIVLTGLAVVLLLAIGWLMNLWAVISSETITTGLFVARCIGIFVAPLGAVLGWF